MSFNKDECEAFICKRCGDKFWIHRSQLGYEGGPSTSYCVRCGDKKDEPLLCEKHNIKIASRDSCPECRKERDSKVCFIATAVYGSYSAPEVVLLREFRDDVLLNRYLGKLFVRLYYIVSPPIADFISSRSTIKKWVKTGIIDPLVHYVEKMRVRQSR